jgi:hypothetical protein
MPCQLIEPDAGREADGAGAFAGGVHRALRRLLHVLEELTFGGARVAQHQHIDVAANGVLVHQLWLAAEHGQRHAHLHVVVPVNTLCPPIHPAPSPSRHHHTHHIR